MAFIGLALAAGGVVLVVSGVFNYDLSQLFAGHLVKRTGGGSNLPPGAAATSGGYYLPSPAPQVGPHYMIPVDPRQGGGWQA